MTSTATVIIDTEPVEHQAGLYDFAREIANDFARETYGLLGVPIDVTSKRAVIHHIEMAAADAKPLLISTTNVNYLATSRRDSEFRDSLIASDICTADGMPIVWLGRLLGVPMKERVAGADLFDLLKHTRLSEPLKVFFFGGAEGVAAAAAANINAQNNGVICTGALFPGFGSVEEMSADHIIDEINASNAHILAVALGAAKAHAWLQRNHDRLKIPIRAHFGATINFQAGTYRRAPQLMREWGLEWLWRLKEEPWLWRRYLTDSIVLGRLGFTHVLPLIVLRQWHRLQWGRADDLTIKRSEGRDWVALGISGIATTRNLEKAAPYLQEAAAANKDVFINFAGTRHIDARFIGALLVLHKRLKEQRRKLSLTAVPRPIERLIRLNGFTFLL